jgi:hypothetical protein
MNSRLILLGLSVAIATATQAQTWDLKNDFSLTTNPNGAWQYGKYDASGVFSTNDTIGSFFGFGTGWMGDGGSGRPFVGVNTSGSTAGGALPGQVFVHPDFSSEAHPFAGAHWVSTVTNTVHVSGTFYTGDTNTVSEFISINRTSFLGTHLDEGGDWNFNFDVAVSAGDFLDFFVGPNNSGSPAAGTTPLDIHITASSVPEPASFAVLGLGALALIRRKKRS